MSPRSRRAVLAGTAAGLVGLAGCIDPEEFSDITGSSSGSVGYVRFGPDEPASGTFAFPVTDDTRDDVRRLVTDAVGERDVLGEENVTFAELEEFVWVPALSGEEKERVESAVDELSRKGEDAVAEAYKTTVVDDRRTDLAEEGIDGSDDAYVTGTLDLFFLASELDVDGDGTADGVYELPADLVPMQGLLGAVDGQTVLIKDPAGYVHTFSERYRYEQIRNTDYYQYGVAGGEHTFRIFTGFGYDEYGFLRTKSATDLAPADGVAAIRTTPALGTVQASALGRAAVLEILRERVGGLDRDIGEVSDAVTSKIGDLVSLGPVPVTSQDVLLDAALPVTGIVVGSSLAGPAGAAVGLTLTDIIGTGYTAASAKSELDSLGFDPLDTGVDSQLSSLDRVNTLFDSPDGQVEYSDEFKHGSLLDVAALARYQANIATEGLSRVVKRGGGGSVVQPGMIDSYTALLDEQKSALEQFKGAFGFIENRAASDANRESAEMAKDICTGLRANIDVERELIKGFAGTLS